MTTWAPSAADRSPRFVKNVVLRGMYRVTAAALLLLLVACGTDAVEVSSAPSAVPSAPSATSSARPATGAVEPAPGSESVVYGPNPGAIIVAIDAGHGGCLDWGVPDPSERGVELAEKTLTLGIARALESMLVEDGVEVVMTRDADEALAGDDYPPLACEGPPFRDVNGDGMSGFGDEDLPEATRTRDELQARLDLANLAQADALVSIHINSPFDAGQPVEIAFTETFYTDETPWGVDATARLADALQAAVVERLSAVASYERGDRGTTAHNFYLVAPPLLTETDERPNRWAQPTRGGQMPVVLSEVGSITLRAEHDLLATPDGQAAVAAGLFDGLAAFFGERELAGRIGLAEAPEFVPGPVEGDGPPYWPQTVPDGVTALRLTNTGMVAWPESVALVAGWEATDEPYLAFPPSELTELGVEIPPLGPGESVVVEVELPAAPAARGVAWISLMTDGETLADHGSPALQLQSRAP